MVRDPTLAAEQAARRARVDDRRVLNGILWRFRTGSPWADIPERYGPHTTCYNRFVRWRKAGVWDHLLEEVSKAFDGDILLADKSYDSNAIRRLATKRGAWANIPAKSNRKDRFAFSKWLYRQRNLVERFFNKLEQSRAIATRYDKNPLNFLAAVKLASIRIWLPSYESTA